MSGELLLNPGPVTLTPRVRNALAGPDLCHREAEFFDLQDDIRARLLAVHDLAPDDWAAVVISGSGTAAVESMMASLPGEGARVLVIENGVYGERMTRMAEVHDIDHDTLRLDWGEAIDMAALSARIDAVVPTHVAVVHHETTTGRLNDLADIAHCCERHGVALLVDAVSSFGAEAIEFAPAVTAVAATANKCLHGAPGAAFVIVRRRALARAVPRALYLDLAGYCAKQDARGTPFTPGIPAFYALAEALQEHAEAGGWSARRDRYRQLADQVEAGLVERGIERLLPPGVSSAVLRAYRLPPGVSYDRLHDGLKTAGYVIYAGQGTLADEIFRISTMGALEPSDMTRLIETIDEIIAR
ncbi:aminotransferase class V-fold PLP-dependent enzyme [Salinisphaera sp. Q1T1-3]|uniref:aminotransferase class V-fold PLP-dependent enzyme n=1 Tax=Salinisphaera sp. Q1T1-3 TaxID=2321229 RepID=UPI000E751FAE|nr:aminotransferase class V-fold PLP-dependent enzyme [Salinisphaera sp. Q1T1-3]RJS93959.1 aminotransferase class V-fold PLP-dependent enzyme [Salinisphaera sp. Q1T1-3]